MRAHVGQLDEPDDQERARFAERMRAHSGPLQARYDAAEALARAYDRLAIVTKDGNPEVPAAMQAEIDDLIQGWDAFRYARDLMMLEATP